MVSVLFHPFKNEIFNTLSEQIFYTNNKVRYAIKIQLDQDNLQKKKLPASYLEGYKVSMLTHIYPHKPLR